METDPSKINDYNRKREATIWQKGQKYAEQNEVSKEQTEARKADREDMEKIDIDPSAFHAAVGLIKRKTPAKLAKYLADFNLVLKVLGKRQQELFPTEMLALAKREQAEKDRAAKKAKADKPAKKTETKASAKKAAKKTNGKAGNVVKPDQEQADGDKVLKSMAPATEAAKKGKPESQSEVARKKLEDAGLSGKPH